ncbi:MAG: heme A synthase, partial [Siphonobacter sp.]
LLQKNSSEQGILNTFANVILTIVLGEIITGVIMAYFAIPAYLQPVHLTLALVMLGVQFVTYLLLNAERVFGKANFSQTELTSNV